MSGKFSHTDLMGELHTDSEGKGGYDRETDIVDEMREHYLQTEANMEMEEVNKRREELNKERLRREAEDQEKLQKLKNKLAQRNKPSLSKFTQPKE